MAIMKVTHGRNETERAHRGSQSAPFRHSANDGERPSARVIQESAAAQNCRAASRQCCGHGLACARPALVRKTRQKTVN